MARKIVAPQRREQIIEALFDCLAEKGHEKITVKDIAARAKLHYGVIHYYFKSKDEIISAVADYIISRYASLLAERLAGAGSAADKVRVALDFLVDESIFNRRMNRVFYNLVQMAFERKAIRDSLRKLVRVYRGNLAQVVGEGVAKGEFASRDSSETASLMVALIEGMALQWVIEPEALEKARIKRLVSEAIEKRLTDSQGSSSKSRAGRIS
ncbi:MAG: TetR family transcriptional regulator C-terminal domain-containing protein [Candidatus Lindowbacteria bacterium]|nr:TetR family transcriptional regulator C-terminal domain-containing protein [Candidatus Lindowbacteria bacterium]